MERARKTFSLSDGRELIVWESNWDMSSERARIEERSRAQKAQANGSGDSVYFYFVESFYSYLASCSTGPIPSEAEALALSDQDLDEWYLALVEVNPEGFLPVDFRKKKEIVFRDGSTFTIVSSYLPSSSMKRAKLEEEALRLEADREHPKDVFSVYLYPMLAGCSRGEIPSPQEVRDTWPEMEIYRWRDAVEEINPHLFGAEVQTQAVEKKREKRLKK